MADHNRSDLLTEYYKLLDIVIDFDKRLLTIKGWGVTLSLAALAWGFQEQHYGLFLVACLSGLAFWACEGVIKRHQMRFYVRMREIEVLSAGETETPGESPATPSSPQIDWSWKNAPGYFGGTINGPLPQPKRYTKNESYMLTWLYPHVALPHVISVLVGGMLFIIGRSGLLNMGL